MPSADLLIPFFLASAVFACVPGPSMLYAAARTLASGRRVGWWSALGFHLAGLGHVAAAAFGISALLAVVPALFTRSEEHTSELQSLMRISYAVFCLKKKKQK